MYGRRPDELRRAPDQAFELCSSADETDKRLGRRVLLNWIYGLDLHPGERLVIPDPTDGRDKVVRYDPSRREH